jgi:group I intron endonuclease
MVNPLGQVYIGKTKNFKIRLSKYKTHAHPHHLACASVIKYGFENHLFEIIDSFSGDGVYAEGKEIFWIRTYMSNRNQWPEINGLNLTLGGNGNIGRPQSEKQKAAIAAVMKGHTFNRGRKHTSEARQKITDAQKGRKLDANWAAKVSINNKLRMSKPIISIDKNGVSLKEYPTITEAAKELGISKRSIRLVLQKKQQSTKGYIFKLKYW